ncbi:MAG TPA: sugar nucleotide-binding protein [Verrucomicrobiae bacterium]|nr:sugar nucleotide-binding protein [Verrucomicrobiae bacterium]
MRFLIIGASGFVGRHVLQHCQAAGYPVIGTETTTRHPGLVKFDLQQDRIADCLTPSFLAAGGPAFAVICAGVNQLDRCKSERELSRYVNVVNTIQLLWDLDLLGVTPVFFSSGFVFDGSTGNYAEDAAPCPINEYGRQKVTVEKLIREKMPRGLVIRLDKVIGDDPTESHLFTEWHAAAAERRSVVCIQGQVFSPTLVSDVARAILLGCARGLSGVYNVANPEFFSRADLAREFLRMLGGQVEVIERPQETLGFSDLRPLKTYLDPSKFSAATGLRFTPVREAIQNFLTRATNHPDPGRGTGQPS